MKMNKFYLALVVLVVWCAAGLGFVAPWFFAAFAPKTAAALDFFFLIVPFFAISFYVIGQRHLAPKFVSVPVMLAIGVLSLITLVNLYRILSGIFHWF